MIDNPAWLKFISHNPKADSARKTGNLCTLPNLRL